MSAASSVSLISETETVLAEPAWCRSSMGAAHAMRDGQAAAGFEQRCQMRDQARRVGEVREGVVDHAAVKRLRERHGLNVAATHGHARIRELFGSAPAISGAMSTPVTLCTSRAR